MILIDRTSPGACGLPRYDPYRRMYESVGGCGSVGGCVVEYTEDQEVKRTSL